MGTINLYLIDYCRVSSPKFTIKIHTNRPSGGFLFTLMQSIVDEIDNLIKYDRNHPDCSNRSELVRLAII